MMVINKENIEEYLLLLIDGELSAADEMEVMTFIESHKEYQVLLDQYLETKLENEDFIFEDKESLLQPETIVMPLRKRRSILFAAAGIAAVLLAGTVFKLIVDKDVIVQPSIVIQPGLKIHEDSSIKNAIAVVPKMQPSKTVSLSSNTVKNVVVQKQVSVVNTFNVVDKREDVKPIEPLPVVAFKDIDIASETKIVEPALPVIALASAEENTKKSNGVLPDASRLEGLNALLSQVEVLKDKIEDKSKVFKNMTVAIRLGGREFTIGK